MAFFIKKLSNWIILIVSTLLLIVQVPYETTDNTIDMSQFTLKLNEEFEGDSLDFSVWRDYPGKLRKGGYWGSEQAFVQDGNLRIRTEYLENGKFGPGYYSMGIDSKGVFEQKYGYFECRCILPKGQGLWSAFWLHCDTVGTITNSGRTGTEIDVFESPFYFLGEGKRDIITSNLHYNGYELETKYSNIGIFKANNPYEEYNTYGLAWDENEYIFYINGVETGRSKYGGVSRVAEYMRLSVEVDGADATPILGWSGRIDWNKEIKLPTDFVVDYVRVYQFNKYLPSDSK